MPMLFRPTKIRNNALIVHQILYSFAFVMNQYNGDDTPAVCMIGKIRVFEEALS